MEIKLIVTPFFGVNLNALDKEFNNIYVYLPSSPLIFLMNGRILLSTLRLKLISFSLARYPRFSKVLSIVF
jgi:hypothetical protein